MYRSIHACKLKIEFKLISMGVTSKSPMTL